MNTFYKEFDIGIQKADHIFESAFSKFEISTTEVAILESQGFYSNDSEMIDMYYVESGKLMKNIKDGFIKLVQTVKNLIKKIVLKIKTMIVQRQINKQLNLIKNMLANDKSINITNTVRSVDTKKYIKGYTNYINDVITVTKEMGSKKYDNIEEVDRDHEKYEEFLGRSMVKNGINNSEADTIDMNINVLYKATEEEVKNYEHMVTMIEDEVLRLIKVSEDVALTNDNPLIVNKITQMASGNVSKLSSVMSNITRSISDKFHKLVSLVKHKKTDTDELSEN